MTPSTEQCKGRFKSTQGSLFLGIFCPDWKDIRFIRGMKVSAKMSNDFIESGIAPLLSVKLGVTGKHRDDEFWWILWTLLLALPLSVLGVRPLLIGTMSPFPCPLWKLLWDKQECLSAGPALNRLKKWAKLKVEGFSSGCLQEAGWGEIPQQQRRDQGRDVISCYLNYRNLMTAGHEQAIAKLL